MSKIAALIFQPWWEW